MESSDSKWFTVNMQELTFTRNLRRINSDQAHAVARQTADTEKI